MDHLLAWHFAVIHGTGRNLIGMLVVRMPNTCAAIAYAYFFAG